MSFADRLRKGDWEVRPVELAVAEAMVARLHYSQGGANTETYLHGLFERGRAQPRGIAWWIPPTRNAAHATYPVDWKGVLALSRLVIEEDVPKNAATFLLARSRRQIDRTLWPCLVTYADEWQGHTGTIYRADNWEYLGMTKPEPTYTLNGRMVARKAGPTTRTHEEMLKLGAVMIGKFAKHKFRHVAPGAGKRIEKQGALEL